MVIYVSFDLQKPKQAEELLRKIQLHDLENCYICPSVCFSPLSDADEKTICELCVDLLSACDAVVFFGENNTIQEKELGFAKLIGMEVLAIDSQGYPDIGFATLLPY